MQHTFGWPLDNSTGGGSFLYHLDDNLVSVGFVLHLNYSNPYLSPFEEFQRFKTHPLVRDTFDGGKRLAYGARALTEGGYQSVPKLTFPGGALIGCDAGFVNVPRIKGSHNAMLSGMLAAEAAAAALSAGRSHDELADYEAGWRDLADRQGSVEGAQRQAACGRSSARSSASRSAGSTCGRTRSASRCSARSRTASRTTPRSSRRPNARRSPIRSPTASSPSTGSRRCSCPTPIMRKTSRFICRVSEHGTTEERPSTTSSPAPRRAIARPASMNGWRRAARPKFVINAQNCVHCKTCDIKDPNQNITWVPPEGGGGPNYPNM